MVDFEVHPLKIFEIKNRSLKDEFDLVSQKWPKSKTFEMNKRWQFFSIFNISFISKVIKFGKFWDWSTFSFFFQSPQQTLSNIFTYTQFLYLLDQSLLSYNSFKQGDKRIAHSISIFNRVKANPYTLSSSKSLVHRIKCRLASGT